MHPLATKQLTTIGTWEEWLNAWNTTSSVEMLLGLLQTGLQLPMQDPSDAIIFYLDISDRTGFYEATRSAPMQEALSSGIVLDQTRLRRSTLLEVLNDRAWTELKRLYFQTHREPSEDEPVALHPIGHFGGWSPVYPTEGGYRLLERLLDFLGERNASTNLRSGSERDDIASRFSLRFAEWLMSGTRNMPASEKSEPWRVKIEERRTCSLRIAIALADRFNMPQDLTRRGQDLLERAEWHDPNEFNETLKEMAIDKWGTGRDRHASIEDAFAHSSMLARVYFLRKLRKEMPAPKRTAS